jgi:hypothetical protein
MLILPDVIVKICIYVHLIIQDEIGYPSWEINDISMAS